MITAHTRRRGVLLAALTVAGALAGCGGSSSSQALLVGAVYPQTGGIDQLNGVRIAADLVNAGGGVSGRQVQLVAEDAASPAAAVAAVDRLAAQGVPIVFGTYDTSQAIPASVEAAKRGLTFMENGALADVVTHRGVIGILRTSTDGSRLGAQAASFVNDVVEPRAGLMPATTRVVVLSETDPYGVSVADGAVREAAQLGLNVVAQVTYTIGRVDYRAVAAAVMADRPDVIITAPYVVDAVGFLQAASGVGLHPRAIVGTSSAYTGADLTRAIGTGVVGLFGADKPDLGISTKHLSQAARDLLRRAASAYQARFQTTMSAAALSAFVSAWVMFHDILPKAQSTSQSDVWNAAMTVNLPMGSEVDGSGVSFSPVSAADAGQNQRAAAAISEWVAPGRRATVYPPTIAQQAATVS